MKTARKPDPSTRLLRAVIVIGLWINVPHISLAGDGESSPQPARIPEGMVLIPGGKFVMGTKPEMRSELAQRFGIHPDLFEIQHYREVDLPPFWIDRHEVTNAQYRRFVEATGHGPPHTSYENSYTLEGADDLPVIGINYDDARAYAEWAGKRLPTEEEWEKAARGADGRLYPWGNDWDPRACRRDDAVDGPLIPFPSPVGSHPRDRSPHGVMDMAGNLNEWVEAKLSPGFEYTAITKGGGFMSAEPYRFLCAARVSQPKGNGIVGYIGFRCAMDALRLEEEGETGSVEASAAAPASSSRASALPDALLKRRKPDPALYGTRKIQVFPLLSDDSNRRDTWRGAFVDPRSAEGSETMKDREAITKRVHWDLEARAPYLPDDRFRINFESFWQWGAPLDATFNKDFTVAEFRSTVTDKSLKALIRVEGRTDHVDILYRFTNLGDSPIPGYQEMCFSALGAPNFRDHDGKRTYMTTSQGVRPVAEAWHNVNERIYCQNFMLNELRVRAKEWEKELAPCPEANPAPGFVATVSRDKGWLIAVAPVSSPSIRLFYNHEYSCLHSNPDSSLGPRETKEFRQRIYFIKGGLDDLTTRYKTDLSATSP